MPTVTGVRKELSSDRSHHHIEGVCTDTALHYTRAQVVTGLDRGERWVTKGADGSQAIIREATYCPHGSCYLSPYITTAPDHTTANNLENLKAC
jgi:hypothetical protein